MNSPRKKRITMKLKRPNPLFEKWLTEWRNKAKEENSKMQFCFNLALQSLKQYPLPLNSGRDCKILKGFGNKLCQMIDERLKEHQVNAINVSDNEENVPVVDKASKSTEKSKKTFTATKSPTNNANSKEYVPVEGSGGYAILLTLYTQSLKPTYVGYSTKWEIIREGQHLSHNSFTKPDPGSRYTAWSSMKTLITKNFVIKSSNPPRFSLSQGGLTLAKKLFDKGKKINLDDNINGQTSQMHSRTCEGVESDVICIDLSDDEDLPCIFSKHSEISSSRGNSSFSRPCSSSVTSSSSKSGELCSVDRNEINRKHTATSTIASTETPSVSNVKLIQKHTSSSSVTSSTQSSSQEECFIFPPSTFDIILYIDTCETSGSKALIQDDPILAELKHLGVTYEVKKLKIGDYIWICRDKTSEKELVLPYIVERKRMDDLGHSIKDGRYHEQKFRLKRSGIPHITYVIESYGNNQHVGLPLSTLYQAATNMAIQDGFIVKFTQNIRDTARYLANFTQIMIKMFKEKMLVSCPKENLSEVSLEDDLLSVMTFKEFNQSSSKNKPMRVSDLFVKMLIQIKGMSVDKALAIVEKYPTPALLKRAYDENPGTKGEKLLATIQFGDFKKNIGPVLSKIVHQLFTLDSFP